MINLLEKLDLLIKDPNCSSMNRRMKKNRDFFNMVMHQPSIPCTLTNAGTHKWSHKYVHYCVIVSCFLKFTTKFASNVFGFNLFDWKDFTTCDQSFTYSFLLQTTSHVLFNPCSIVCWNERDRENIPISIHQISGLATYSTPNARKLLFSIDSFTIWNNLEEYRKQPGIKYESRSIRKSRT